jgi:hypothetical protein
MRRKQGDSEEPRSYCCLPGVDGVTGCCIGQYAGMAAHSYAGAAAHGMPFGTYPSLGAHLGKLHCRVGTQALRSRWMGVHWGPVVDVVVPSRVRPVG